MSRERKDFSIGVTLPIPDEPPVSNREFLRSLCVFGAFLRCRLARALLETWEGHRGNESLSIALALGIWEQLGAQVEDLLMFLATVPTWISSGRKDSLANLYFNTFIRESGGTSLGNIRRRLSDQTDEDFLISFGLPTDEGKWTDPRAMSEIGNIRKKLADMLQESFIVKPVQNKLKHGPQIVVSSLPGKLGKALPDMRQARLLFKGAKVAMSPSDPDISHLYIEDSGDNIPMAVDQIEFISRELWLLSTWVYFFSFGKHPHLDEGDGRFQPPVHWFSGKEPADKIW